MAREFDESDVVNRLITVRSGWLIADQLCSRLIKEQVRVKKERMFPLLHNESETDRANFSIFSLENRPIYSNLYIYNALPQ